MTLIDRGLSLLEVLVALVILALGLAVIATMLLLCLRGTEKVGEYMDEMQRIDGSEYNYIVPVKDDK